MGTPRDLSGLKVSLRRPVASSVKSRFSRQLTLSKSREEGSGGIVVVVLIFLLGSRDVQGPLVVGELIV